MIHLVEEHASPGWERFWNCKSFGRNTLGSHCHFWALWDIQGFQIIHGVLWFGWLCESNLSNELEHVNLRVGDNIKGFEIPLEPWEVVKKVHIRVMLCLLKMMRNYRQIDSDSFVDHLGGVETLSNLPKLASWPNLKKIQFFPQFIVISFEVRFHQIWMFEANGCLRNMLCISFEFSDPWWEPLAPWAYGMHPFWDHVENPRKEWRTNWFSSRVVWEPIFEGFTRSWNRHNDLNDVVGLQGAKIGLQ